ncbi:MAG: hypothetical protein KAG45_10725 [Methyloprofundus sp.]|nr:hypothetical protein [Methyloprofundus sp.]
MGFRPGFLINFNTNKKIVEKLAARRDSVMTIQFDNWGADPYLKAKCVGTKFNHREEILLMEFMSMTVECSERVQEAGKSNFKDHHDLLEKWFGLTPDQSDFDDTVQWVVYGINMIHAVLSDNEKIIRFVDRRKRRTTLYDIRYFQPLCFNKPIGEKAFVVGEDVDDEDEEIEGSTWMLDKTYRGKDNLPHVGSGYRLYVGDRRLQGERYKTIRFIVHEMTHKLLGTTDFTDDDIEAYTEDVCHRQAVRNRYWAMEIADCWARFFMDVQCESKI